MRVSLRSRADDTGRCVKLKTITEIRRSSARNTVIEKVYFVLNSLWDWEPVKRLNRGMMWSVLRLLLLLLLLFFVVGLLLFLVVVVCLFFVFCFLGGGL